MGRLAAAPSAAAMRQLNYGGPGLMRSASEGSPLDPLQLDASMATPVPGPDHLSAALHTIFGARDASLEPPMHVRPALPLMLLV